MVTSQRYNNKPWSDSCMLIVIARDNSSNKINYEFVPDYGKDDKIDMGRTEVCR